MVVRSLIECQTCNKPITLRLWVGHNPRQEHAFLCSHCKEEITVGMDVDFEKVSTAVSYIENCARGISEGPIVNVSPHFVSDPKEVGTDQSFPWMGQAKYIRKMSDWQPPERPEGVAGVIIADVYEELGGISNITEMWRIIRKAWSLSMNEQVDLSKKVLGEYAKFGYEGLERLEDVLYDFCLKLLIPKKIELFRGALACLERAQSSAPEELAKFRQFYRAELQEDSRARYFEILSDFFRNYSEYDQTMLYIKNVVPVPDGCVATSNGVKNTKMFYGNAFEHYTANLVVLACLNNVIYGRPFDLFEEMDLAKYMTLNKARRGNPFADNSDLNGFLGCLDSTLRNASHHGAMKMIKHRRYLQYRSGGTGAVREISYSRYLERCGEITLNAAALMLVELVIAS